MQPILIEYVKAIFLLFIINVQFGLFYYYLINYLLSIFSTTYLMFFSKLN